MRLDEGVVVPHERTRTRTKAIDGLVKFVKDFPQIRQLGALQIGDAEIETLLDRLGTVYPREKIVVTDVSPVIAVHVGPGTLGVVIDAGDPATLLPLTRCPRRSRRPSPGLARRCGSNRRRAAIARRRAASPGLPAKAWRRCAASYLRAMPMTASITLTRSYTTIASLPRPCARSA